MTSAKACLAKPATIGNVGRLEVSMADKDNIPKVDRRGTTFLVPLGFTIVFVLLAGLMLMRTESAAPTPPPPATSQPTTQSQ